MTYQDPAIKLLSHVYWVQKKEFMYERDEYACWTLFAVEEGSFDYEIKGDKGEARFGDVVICPPRCVFRRKTKEPLTFHFIQFIRDEGVEGEEDWLGKIRIADTSRLASNYRYLRTLQGWDEASTGHKLHLVNDLLRMIRMERNVRVEAAAAIQDEQMNRARSLLTGQAFGELSMLEVASGLGLTPVQFTRQFRKAFGQTPTDFISDLRMTRARYYLENTTLTLDVIASQCGYENGFYLSRIFTQKVGMAPSVYRSMFRV
ncbi:AraC family transcriptional regulator [Paenibacillus roseipurpureus]|uniref:AraC family transcriptional regulator n=1 Tax=Paenibacillus roseopurpureus TaxID=2918901 RepID=A0AA96RJE8_9BACL|nr:AraC family transcriptional regulator [Paenibacillus sp. MBLB1832]WNR43234.1 AraC family transcriptional regulator [Paenibacillus sp. MBLB1832]